LKLEIENSAISVKKYYRDCHVVP